MKCNIIIVILFVILLPRMKKIDQLYSLINGASRVSVAVHTHPDGDALGSGLALTRYLTECRGKDAVLIVPDDLPESLLFILNDFPQGSIVVFNESPQAAADRIRSSELLCCLDFNNFHRTSPEMEICLKEAQAPKVLIDHHINPDVDSFDLVFSQTETSSTCELLFNILKELPDVNGDVSKLPAGTRYALMTGMTTDTNNFANSVFPGTLEMASELIASGVDRDRILSDLYNNYRENRLRLMGYLLGEMEISPDGTAFMILDKAVQERFDFRQGESEGFVNIPLAIREVRMSVFLTEEASHFRVSVRSKRGVSANEFATRYFHGGGHELAAGGRLYFPEDILSPGDAKAYILKVTREFFG